MSENPPIKVPGTICLHCTRKFCYLIGQTCQKCQLKASGQSFEGLQCRKCGKVFPNLEQDTCGYCEEIDEATAQIHHALDNAPNPARNKNAQSQLASYVRSNSATSEEVAESRLILERVKQAHVNAVQNNHGNSQGIQKSKVKGAVANQAPRHLRTDSVTIKMSSYILKGSSNKAHFLDGSIVHISPKSDPWSKVLELLAAAIRLSIFKMFSDNVVVKDSQISIAVYQSKVQGIQIPSSVITGKVEDVWNTLTEPSLRNNFLSKMEIKEGQLPLIGYVQLSPQQRLTIKRLDSQARKHHLADDSSDIEPAEEPSSIRRKVSAGQSVPQTRVYQTRVYNTKINRADEISLIHLDITLERDEKGGEDARAPTMVESQQSLQGRLGKEIIAAGKTKDMFKLIIQDDIFAAKSFRDGLDCGQSLTMELNNLLVEQELACHVICADLAKQFQEYAESKNADFYEFSYSKAWIAKVTSGPKAGWYFIVDPMLSTTTIKKFSGTDQAGQNDKRMGRTMDAFAHFCLAVSEETVLPVDIQGIEQPMLVAGYADLPQLILFDTMTHTKTGDSGIGDQGFKGIQEFKSQHRCNSICKELKFTPLFSTENTIPDKRGPGRPAKDRTTSTPNVVLKQIKQTTIRRSTRLNPGLKSIVEAEEKNENNLKNLSFDSHEVHEIIFLRAVRRHNGAWGEYWPAIPRKGILYIPKEPQWRRYYAGLYEYIPIGLSEDTNIGERLLIRLASYPLSELTFEQKMTGEVIRFKNISYDLRDFLKRAASLHVKVATMKCRYSMLRSEVINQATKKTEWIHWLCGPLPLDFQARTVGPSTGAEDSANLIAQTLSALSHFVLDVSKGQRVHSTWSYMPDDHIGLKGVITSSCTHHIKPFRGAHFDRDDGEPGIQRFRREHKCSAICTRLNLRTVETILVEENPASEEDFDFSRETEDDIPPETDEEE
ncbi:hypothetical protein M422DRAFT_261432 [Sphaerobolus stellatus SS14]|uniref:Alpha-type protein kinase domain-containing protein n=1 Tax=Sphaerobolus stellatus (strain SS14) TaxID=990650 RepID=A0A0C9VFV6_SPHS4|nr:hypothetical protein M422DRAFT_261432 [Sphaerobolus stellatus SS14]